MHFSRSVVTSTGERHFRPGGRHCAWGTGTARPSPTSWPPAQRLLSSVQGVPLSFAPPWAPPIAGQPAKTLITFRSREGRLGQPNRRPGWRLEGERAFSCEAGQLKGPSASTVSYSEQAGESNFTGLFPPPKKINTALREAVILAAPSASRLLPVPSPPSGSKAACHGVF